MPGIIYQVLDIGYWMLVTDIGHWIVDTEKDIGRWIWYIVYRILYIEASCRMMAAASVSHDANITVRSARGTTNMGPTPHKICYLVLL